MRTLFSVFLLVCLTACLPQKSEQKEPEIVFERTSIEILRRDREPLTLQAELADTDAKRMRGLMFRSSLPENEGMLFDFPVVKKIPMWMANTSIPLDMLFIDSRGYITEIVENTAPFSHDRIVSQKKSKAVLELNGGASERLGIREGDIVRHAIFKLEKQP